MNPEEPMQSPAQTPKNNKNIILILVGAIVAVLLVVGVVMTVNNSGKKSTQQKQAKQLAEVSVTSGGFVPATLAITKGTTVTWKNADDTRHQIASEPYPSHSNLEGLFSVEPLNTGDTYSYTFNEAGTFNYLDQLNPYKVKGVVIVK